MLPYTELAIKRGMMHALFALKKTFFSKKSVTCPIKKPVLGKWCIVLACTLPLSMPVQAEKQIFIIGDAVAADSRSDRARLYAAATAQVNGMALPAYGISTEDPMGGRLRTAPARAPSLNTAATAEQLRQLQVVYISHGWLLLPRGWQLKSGGIGANGSEAWTFAAADGSGWLRYQHSGACVGCAQSAAAPFFPEARRDAQENDFDFYGKTDVPIKSVRLRPHLMAYSAEKNKRRIDGLVHYKADDDLPHWHLEVSLPATQHGLARPILNRLVPKR